jgi:hypothetical protein
LVNPDWDYRCKLNEALPCDEVKALDDFEIVLQIAFRNNHLEFIDFGENPVILKSGVSAAPT